MSEKLPLGSKIVQDYSTDLTCDPLSDFARRRRAPIDEYPYALDVPREEARFIAGVERRGEIKIELNWIPAVPPAPEVIESEFCIQRRQIRFPRTRKRRIQKKWAKDPRNFRDEPAAYLVESQQYRGLFGGPERMRPVLLIHPVLKRQWDERFKRAAEAHQEHVDRIMGYCK